MEIWIASTSAQAAIALLRRVVTDEGALAVDCRKIERGAVDGIEVLFALGELIGKDVGECGDLNAGVLSGERGSDRGTAASASEQAVAHARIGSVAGMQSRV